MARGLQHFSDRIGDGVGRPRLNTDAGEELMHVQTGVAIAFVSCPPEFPGTLYITTKRVVWLSDVDRTKGYEVDFLSVSLHAVSRDPEAYPSPCIYAQIETDMEDGEKSDGSDSECAGEVELPRITEMRLVPSDPGQLDMLFNVFCECAELNPDPNQDQDEENEWFHGDEEMADNVDDSEWHASEDPSHPIGYANGGEELAHTVLELHINDQRFEDADEVDGDQDGDRK